MRKVLLATSVSLLVALGVTGLSSVCAATSKVAKNTTGRLFKGKVSYPVARAEDLLIQRKYEHAADLFREQIKRNPKDIDAVAGLGTALVMQFKLDGASEQFDKVLARDPANAIAHTGKAMVAINRLQSSSKAVIDKRAGLLMEAESEARLAVSNDPQFAPARYALGLALKEQEKNAEAYKAFQEAVELDPQYSDGYAGLGMIELGEDRLAEAMSNFRKAIELNPGNSTAHYGLGEALLRQGLVEEAIKELNISLYQFRNSAPVHLALGKAYETQGNIAAALKQYEHAALIKPELTEAYARMAALHIAQGKQYEAQKNTVAALKEYRQATLIDPHNPDPYLRMADLRERRGDLELAVAELRSGSELMPQNPVLHQRLGETLLRLEKLDEAIKEFETTLELQPGNVASSDGLARAFYLKAQKESPGSFLLSNDYENAEIALQRAIRLHPNDLRLRLALAKLRAVAGEPVDTTQVGTPQNDAERISYAEALLAQNKFSEAAEQMRDVISHTSAPQQLAAVADMALMMKDLDSAELAYKKAAANGQSDRARRGLASVARVREEARRHLRLGQDLARKKQLASAVDSFRLAMFQNPRQADARWGLAEALQRLSPDSPTALRESATQYKAYLALAKDLPAKVRAKTDKRIARIEARAFKLEQKTKVARAN
ncbi:MAG TPA: tetratricopeptide repeat protein [Candidatus Obscuribacterales bacterium]